MTLFYRICLIFGALGIAASLSALPLHKIEGKCVQPKDFSKAQKQVIIKAFKYGAKSGFGYTMAAIAWKESCAGEYRVNFSDPSAGIYHAHIPGIIKKHNQKDSSFMRNMVGELLMRDDEFASRCALEELSYWHKVRKGNWYEVIKSYNKGFSWEKDKARDKMAQEYFEDVAWRVKALQAYLPKVASRELKAAKKDHALEFLNTAVQVKTISQSKATQKLDSKSSSESTQSPAKSSAKSPTSAQNKSNLPKDFKILEE